MKSNSSKSLVQFVIAAIILIAVNAWVWMGVGNGSLSPVEHRALWITFMVLNIASLLWAVRLLGLQPLVMACSYALGGFLAYSGVGEGSGISVAEVTTAGATYGAIGALVVGNIGTKVRVAFIHKGQVPFVFVIIGLLVVDGVLNSQISGAGWAVVLNALIFPFMLAGVVLGLGWVVVSRMGILPHAHTRIKPISETEARTEESMAEEEDEADADSSQLVIRMPGLDVDDEETDEPAPVMAEKTEPLQREASIPEEVVAELSVETTAVEDAVEADNFFPLDIDKGEELVLPPEESSLSSVLDLETEEYSTPILSESDSDLSVDAIKIDVEPVIEADTKSVAEETGDEFAAVEEPPTVECVTEEEIPVDDPVSVEEKTEGEPAVDEKESAADDWLHGHLDLLNKLGNKE